MSLHWILPLAVSFQGRKVLSRSCPTMERIIILRSKRVCYCLCLAVIIFSYSRYAIKLLPLLSSPSSEDSTGGLPARIVKLALNCGMICLTLQTLQTQRINFCLIDQLNVSVLVVLISPLLIAQHY